MHGGKTYPKMVSTILNCMLSDYTPIETHNPRYWINYSALVCVYAGADVFTQVSEYSSEFWTSSEGLEERAVSAHAVPRRNASVSECEISVGDSAVAVCAGPGEAVVAAVRPNVHIVELALFAVQLLSLNTSLCPSSAPSTRPSSVPWCVQLATWCNSARLTYDECELQGCTSAIVFTCKSQRAFRSCSVDSHALYRHWC